MPCFFSFSFLRLVNSFSSWSDSDRAWSDFDRAWSDSDASDFDRVTPFVFAVSSNVYILKRRPSFPFCATDINFSLWRRASAFRTVVGEQPMMSAIVFCEGKQR